MIPDDAANLSWRKSTYSNAGNECVEVAQFGHTLLIRDSKTRGTPYLELSKAAWSHIVNGIKQGRRGRVGI